MSPGFKLFTILFFFCQHFQLKLNGMVPAGSKAMQDRQDSTESTTNNNNGTNSQTRWTLTIRLVLMPWPITQLNTAVLKFNTWVYATPCLERDIQVKKRVVLQIDQSKVLCLQKKKTIYVCLWSRLVVYVLKTS